MTREQAAAMLYRLAAAAGKPLPDVAASFADNGSISSWASKEVGAVQAAGIMNGVGGNRFDLKGGLPVFSREILACTFEFCNRSYFSRGRRRELDVYGGLYGLLAAYVIYAVSARRPETLILPGAVRRKRVSVVWPLRQW